jgi:XTP/dITP diphosphohydrolase
MQLVIASRNLHKIRELRAMLKEYRHLDALSLLDFPDYVPPPEGDGSFAENAAEKALHAAKALGQWTLSDDSGLVVPALQGAPGIRSARYAGETATDAENRGKLLFEMRSLADLDRQAYYECSLAIASPKGLEKSVRGLCEGTILAEPRGNRGFGYDPLFVKYEYGKTFAEIEETLKNRISHRRKALTKLHVFLLSLGEGKQ